MITSPFYTFFAWISKVILGNICWQVVWAAGVAAVKLTVSQLVPEINTAAVQCAHTAVCLTFFFYLASHLCLYKKIKIWLVNGNGRYHNIAVVKLSIGHMCFKSILSAFCAVQSGVWRPASFSPDLQIATSLQVIAVVGGLLGTNQRSTVLVTTTRGGLGGDTALQVGRVANPPTPTPLPPPSPPAHCHVSRRRRAR